MDKWYKILKIIVMVMVIVSFCTKIFAVDVTINSHSYTLKTNFLSNNYDYFLVYKYVNNNNLYYVFCGSTTPIKLDNVSNSQRPKFTYMQYKCTYYLYGYSSLNATQVTNSVNTFNNATIPYNTTTTVYSTYPTYINTVFDSSNITADYWNAYTSKSILLSNHDIYDVNNNKIFTANYFTAPQIITSTTDIEDWSFDYLEIKTNSVEYDIYDYLYIGYNGNLYKILIYHVLDYVENDILYIDRQRLSNYITFVDEADMGFIYYVENGSTIANYNLGTYHITLDTEYVNDLNNNSEQNWKNEISNQFEIFNTNWEHYQETAEDTNESVKEINNTLTDDTVTSSASDLPSINVSDPTSNGLDSIFTSIYNAFCSGNPQNIVLPFPHTNKVITINPNYVKNSLQNNNCEWIYNFIVAFWGYLFGRYIIKDIIKKIEKIKSRKC